MLEIALASQSPRRRELLTQAAYDFRVFPVKVSEIIDENLNPEEVASHLATLKVMTCIGQNKLLKEQGFLILGADTLVVVGKQILGKPKNIYQAHEYLRLLSGRMHSVISGICLYESGTSKVWSGSDQTSVQFKTLTEDEILDYIASGEPMDKAGAYAIQGEGKKFVSSYVGSWSNVVGLPMERLERALKENGWTIRQRPAEKS